MGVQGQYSGTLGRIDNCQIATFLAYVTPGRDRVLLDRRLYLPKESWVADPARCAAAGVPLDAVFKTRPEQVREMIESALEAGVPFAWFTADEEFGQRRPLGGSLPRRLLDPVNHYPGFQITPDELEDLAVVHLARDPRHEHIEPNPVKKPVQVDVHNPLQAVLDTPPRSPHRLVGGLAGTKSKGRAGKEWIEYRRKEAE